jgi:Rieske Fe-S protein
VAGACALSAVAGGVRVAVPNFEEGLPKRFPLGRPSDFKMNTLIWLQDRDLFVMRNEDGMGAFSCRCTHLGCMVRRTADGFVCPCHGAEYGSLGEVISGPARRPLPWYRVWLERDGRLWVDVARPLEEVGPQPVVLPQGNRGKKA